MRKSFRNTISKIAASMLAAAVIFTSVLGDGTMTSTTAYAASATSTAARQVESLDRGLVAIKTSTGIYIGWRYLGTDSEDISFNIYRDGTKVNSSAITDCTNYLDKKGTSSSTYCVKAVIDGKETETSETVSVVNQNYMDINLQVPDGGTTPDGTAYTYSPNDASVGDLDGDGEYEIILKWDPSNSKDNSKDGYTGNVIIDAYKLDGTLLWRIDLGINIRAGAHYTQFMVYDFDGDGSSELVCKTADGTKDGAGNYVGDKSADYRSSTGRILTGPEYLTLFDGETGAALDTIDYEPGRGKVSDWGDSYGNRVDRFLGAVAYLDGETPSIVMCRGYYTRTVLVAYDVVDNKLVKRWKFDSNDSGNSKYAGNGNHNLAVADVDSDGYDEIVYGACTIDNDGTGLYSLGRGHGDAVHVGDFIPSRDGLEVFGVFEDTYGCALWDAATGKIIFEVDATTDTGRGIAGNFISGNSTAEFSSTADNKIYSGAGKVLAAWSSLTKWSQNYAVYWDADLEQEAMDRTMIDDYDDGRILTASGVTYINGTKGNCSLVADILGDWREEVIWPTTDGSALRIYMTTDVTSYRIATLMHDTQYRCQVAAQNVGYNQGAYTSFFLGTDKSLPDSPNVYAAGTKGNTSGSTSGSTSDSTVTTSIADGWYYIKNVNAQKYLQVENNTGSDGQNVEISTGTGKAGQKWYLTNQTDGSFTLKNALGYMLDISNGTDEDGTNVQTWSANGYEPQQYMLASTGTSGQYGILTKVSDGTKALDVYNFGTEDGSNVCQWTYYANTCQLWVFESTSYSSGSSSSSGSTTETTTQASTTTASDWNFSSSDFSSLGKITSNKTVDGLTLVATSSKYMTVKSCSTSYNGTKFTSYLALGGTGSTSYRSVKLGVSGSCTITITAKSGGSSTRNLVVCDSSGTVLTTISCTSSVAATSYTYTGSAGDIYIYSQSGGMNLYEVSVK